MTKLKINLPEKVITPRLLMRETFARETDLEIDLLARDNCDILTSFYEFPDEYITSDRKELSRIKNLVNRQTLKTYGIFKKGNPYKLIGQTILDTDRLKSPRVGFYIAKDARRKGYAAEAHKHMLAAISSQNSKIKTIWEEVVVGNHSSRNLLIKNGFRITGIRQSSSFGLDDKSQCLRRALN
jgi:RimJ/RimL family protein N-acetyltransferase